LEGEQRAAGPPLLGRQVTGSIVAIPVGNRDTRSGVNQGRHEGRTPLPVGIGRGEYRDRYATPSASIGATRSISKRSLEEKYAVSSNDDGEQKCVSARPHGCCPEQDKRGRDSLSDQIDGRKRSGTKAPGGVSLRRRILEAGTLLRTARSTTLLALPVSPGSEVKVSHNDQSRLVHCTGPTRASRGGSSWSPALRCSSSKRVRFALARRPTGSTGGIRLSALPRPALRARPGWIVARRGGDASPGRMAELRGRCLRAAARPSAPDRPASLRPSKAGLGCVRRAVIDPAAWFLEAHFYQDPVMPGSLGVEAMHQAMAAFAQWRGWVGHFIPLAGHRVV